MNEEDYNELVVNVYSCEGRIGSLGYSSQKQMINFNYDGISESRRGKSGLLIRLIALSLKNSICKKSGVNRIRFNFPERSEAIPIYADGYFGRPEICVGAIFLKPLYRHRKTAIIKEVNKIGEIQDRWGRAIEFTA